MRALAVLPLLVSLWAGCATAPDCVEPIAAGVWVPQVTSSFLERDPGAPWQTVALAHAGPAATTTMTLNGTDAGTVEPVASAAALQRVSVPASDSFARLEWAVREEREGCHAGRFGHVNWSFPSPTTGDVATAGKGVHVWYAGFFENGTMFDTNIRALDQSAWPRTGWYASEPYDALPVYLYDKDRSERDSLPIWSVGTAPSPVRPPTGDVTLYSYYTTIKGFNDGLKGLSTTTTRVVWMPAADAYATPRADLPAGLTGQPLVFFVKLDSVEPLPCTADPQGCVPNPLAPGGRPV